MKNIAVTIGFVLLLSITNWCTAGTGDALKSTLALSDDTSKVVALHDLALDISNSNTDSAIMVTQQALAVAQKLRWEDGIAKSYNMLGMFNSAKGENRLALDYYSQALEMREEQEASASPESRVRVTNQRQKTLGNIGVVYMDLGDYPRALDYLFEALNVAESTGYKDGIAAVTSNIGMVYSSLNEKDKALDYYFRSLHAEEELDNKPGIAISLGNIGSVYHDNGEYVKSLDYFEQALKLSGECNDQDGVAVWLGNIGMAYEQLKMTDTAFACYFRALEIAEQTGNASTISTELRAIGSLYSDIGKYEEAEEFLLRALELDEETESLSDVMEDEKELSELFYKAGKFELALKHYQKFAAAKDSVYSQENTAQSVRAEMNYEFARKEAQHEADEQLAKTMRNFVIVVAILLLLLTAFILNSRNNRKTLRLREQHSHQLLLAQEREKQRIAKELHDSIGQNILFIKNQLIKQDDQTLLRSVDETLEEVRNISKDLYPNQLEKYGLIAAVEALAEKVNESSSVFVSHDLEAFGKDIPADKQINYFRIIQECISNAVKHSEATALRITATATHGHVELVVQDNGKGFDRQLAGKKAQSSFGLLNIEERVSYLKGKFDLQTSPGNGTKYVFTLPA